MSWLGRRLFNRWMGAIVALVALSSFLIVSYAKGNLPWLDHRPMRERYRVYKAFRTDLAPVLNAPGNLESARRTMIRCELENIAGADNRRRVDAAVGATGRVGCQERGRAGDVR